MKKWFVSIIGTGLLLGLAACSDDPSVDNHPKEQVVPSDNQDREQTPDTIQVEDSGNKSHEGQVQNDQDAAEMMQDLNFTEFELEVNYGPNEEIDYEYKQKSNDGDYKAEMKDTVKNVIYKGMEAFTALHTQLKDLELNANMDKEAAIQEILDRFDLDADYSKFELEVTFKDGSKLDIEDRKTP
ncbi:hypothetical protein J8TS2_34300 [Lederbergia ruris]|uniref:YusW-like protein n=1 Tax=Lederbergia ruris TaxID=217495 RepID=A0ABQ4KNQ3_9BACI|nr:YusW family protein [Lederbergia ruris]GIN59111.1 hypothetical protein J8TS2_34300 [Lederbergia ruris]